MRARLLFVWYFTIVQLSVAKLYKCETTAFLTSIYSQTITSVLIQYTVCTRLAYVIYCGYAD